MALGLVLLTGLGSIPVLLLLWGLGSILGVVYIAEALERTDGLVPTRRTAVFGGDLHKSARDLAERDDVALFGSSGHTGQGELRRFSASLRAGMIDRVCLVLRWAGHSEVEAIRALCRAQGVVCELFTSVGAVRRALRGPRPAR